MLGADEQLELLTSDVAEVVPMDALEAKLREQRPLRVKLGMDPTAEHVTLGWAVPLRLLRRFQDLGHTAVLIVGDYTARIGDPSGANKTRPMLSSDEVDAYVERVLEQFRLILSEENLEVRRNSEWLETLGTQGLLELASLQTVAQVLQRDDFSARFSESAPITLRELMYPLLQGYDSVAVEADVELGGTDQHFNLMVGRDLQRAHGQDPQVVMTVPLIEGTDGVKKMSQSLGNYVAITEAPDEMFGKLMRVPDELMPKYLRLCTDLSEAEIAEVLDDRPESAKRRLAGEVVRLYHGEDAAAAARERFDSIFVAHEAPEEITEHDIPSECVREDVVHLPGVLKAIGLASSTTEARRLIAQGGVRIDGEAVDGDDVERTRLVGAILQVGKRRFARLRG